MSAFLGFSAAPRRQPVVLCVAVAVGIVVGCALLEHLWAYHGVPALARRAGDVPVDLLDLVVNVTPYLVYALALAVWGLDRRHRIAGAACAASAGLTIWGFGEVLYRSFSNQPTQTILRALDWGLTLLVPTLLALAWGLARRRGRAWVLGIVVAPVLAAMHHQLFEHARWWWTWELGLGQWWERELLYLTPAILAAVVCWLLERGTAPGPVPAPAHHEEVSSAT